MEVYYSAEDYMGWDVSNQEGVEEWVMFSVTRSPPLPLLDHVLLCMRHCSYYCQSASVGLTQYDGLPEAADILKINYV